MYGEEQETEITKISKINSAGLINLRLHRLWEDCNKHSREGKFLSWNGDLDRIWCELAGDVDEGKETENKWGDIKKGLKPILPFRNWKLTSGFQDISMAQIKLKSGQYEALMEKEIFLRKLMNKQGKGSAYQDSIDDYMDE